MTEDGGLGPALEQIVAGGVVAAATETLFGLLADARSGPALDRIFVLKRREAQKPSALLLPDRDAWQELVSSVPQAAATLADSFWPGPLTIALPARTGLDERLVLQGRVAVRLAGPSPASRLAAAAGRVLTATSANISGCPACLQDDEVRNLFGAEEKAGWLTILAGRAPGGPPSTVVSVEQGAVRLLRSGAIPRSAIESALERRSVGHCLPLADAAPRQG